VHRTISTLLALAISSACMAGMVRVSGTSMSRSTPVAASPSLPIAAPFVDAGTCLNAPMSIFAAPGAAGWVTVCDDGQDVRITLQAIGLAPGEQHTAWLGYRALPTTCRETACRPIDRESDDPAGGMHTIGHAIAQPSGDLDLNSRIRGLRLLHGAEIMVQLLGELGRAGPYLQADIVVP
jgi:hypothetical protein